MENLRALEEADVLGLDIEGKDPNLRAMGPGCYRKDGYISGVTFATKEVATYFPIAHPDTTPEERERNLKIITSLAARNVPKVGANILYDLDWLHASGIPVAGQCHDVQYAEPLLNEYAYSYSLDSLAAVHGEEAKATDLLQQYCDTVGWKTSKETPPQAYIWRMPSAAVKKYAELDGMLPLRILQKQLSLLESQNLLELYQLEIDLIPLLLRMRQQGVRLDIPQLKKTAMAVAEEHHNLQQELYEFAGKEFNIGSTPQLSRIFDAHNIPYHRNEPTEYMKAKAFAKGTVALGNPNLDKEALTELSHQFPICKKILDFRHYDTLINMFLVPYLEFNVNGRLHCQFHPLRSDDYGTVSGRFSSTKPNLQQVPAMSDKEDDDANESLKGQIIRRLFIPEEGCSWAKLDYSQVEYRIAAHYAIGPGAEELREDYRTNPNTDYHKRIQDKTGFDRRQCKRLNFGASYGMGRETAAKKFGWTLEEAEMFMEGYHSAAPYLKATRRRVVQTAERRGFIFTLLGRKARVHPSRALHSMFNRLIQGSAADIMKLAMVQAHKKGLFDVLMPHLTVHDEIDVSVPPTKEGDEALKELHYTMEHAIELEVPLKVDCNTGENWSEAD